MAISRIQQNGASGSGTIVSVSFLSANTVDNLLVAHVASEGSAAVIDDLEENVWLNSQAETVVNTNNRTRLQYVINVSAATLTVQATFGASSAAIVNIAEYSGIDTTTPLLAQTNAGTGFGTAASSGNITTTIADALLIGTTVTENTAGTPIAPGTDWTEVVETARGSNTPANGHLEERIVAATGTYAATATLTSSTNWATQICGFAAAAIPATITLTGTAVGGINEADIVTGGRTVIATVSDDTYVPAQQISDITFVANALGGTATTTTFSITLPTTQADDVIILEFTHRGTGNGTIAGTYSGPAFTLKHSQTYNGGTFSGKTYYSRASGNHSGQTVTGSGLTDSCAAIITIYRGAAQSGDPLSDATVVGEENASGNETQAQITTATDKAWVVLVTMTSPDVAFSTQACTSPGTLTERAERLSTGGTDTAIAHASAAKATAGATGAFTWAMTNQVNGSWAYAIKPHVTAPFDDARQAFIDGFDSAQSEANGWDAKRSSIPVSAVVRTSGTVVTMTLPAIATYDITATETITVTVPASILAGASAVVATPTMTITAAGGAGAFPFRATHPMAHMLVR